MMKILLQCWGQTALAIIVLTIQVAIVVFLLDLICPLIDSYMSGT